MTSTFRCRACGKEWQPSQMPPGSYGSLKYCPDDGKLCDEIKPPAEQGTPEPFDYFCQWCYDKGLRYSAGEWKHSNECPNRPWKCAICDATARGDICTRCGFRGPTDTPRVTRFMADNPRWMYEGPNNLPDFAKQLERELLAAQAERDSARALHSAALREIDIRDRAAEKAQEQRAAMQVESAAEHRKQAEEIERLRAELAEARRQMKELIAAQDDFDTCAGAYEGEILNGEGRATQKTREYYQSAKLRLRKIRTAIDAASKSL